MSEPETTVPLPDAYYEQLRRAYEDARNDCIHAATEGRAAQARWQAAVDREMEASRRYRDAMQRRYGLKD